MNWHRSPRDTRCHVTRSLARCSRLPPLPLRMVADLRVRQRRHPPNLLRSPLASVPMAQACPSTFTPMASRKCSGAKQWFLCTDKPPRFRANATSVSWLKHDYPLLTPSERPFECTIWPGDLLYFPHGWYHAIINRGDPTVFMSVFL